MDLKKQLRLKFRQWLNENVTSDISLFAGESISNQIKQKFIGIHQVKISIFISKLPEISTLPLIDHLYSIGAQVFIPTWHSGEMWMCKVESRKKFDDICASAPSNKIPMPQNNPVPIEVICDVLFFIHVTLICHS